MTLDQDLKLLDWTGRQFRKDQTGRIPDECAPILERLRRNAETWLDFVKNFGKRFRNEAGLLSGQDRHTEVIPLFNLKSGSSIAGLRYPSHGRSRQTGRPIHPSAEGRSHWLNFLRKILSFSIPNRFYPGTLCPQLALQLALRRRTPPDRRCHRVLR